MSSRPTPVALRALLLVAVTLGGSAALYAKELPKAATRVEIMGLVTDSRVAEISGLAASRRRDGVLWAHNDSGNTNSLFALSPRGAVIAEYTIDGVDNVDWEDIASFELDGQPWLLCADMGDNGALRPTVRFILVPEPDIGSARSGRIKAEWILEARWPDGPRDAESMAVDPASRTIYMLSKRRVPVQVFALALAPPEAADEVRTIQQIGTLPGIPQPSQEEIAASPEIGRWLGQPTAMDRRADGAFVVITYRDAYLFIPGPGDDAAATLRRTPFRLGLPRTPQAEAVAFARDGRAVFATTERLPAPILRARLERRVQPVR
jgi:hypothetical protein